MTITKTYGIMKTCIDRYAIVTDINEDKTRYEIQYRSNYARPEYALRKAKAFVRAVHKDFIGSKGVPIHFEFVNMGEVERMRGE